MICASDNVETKFTTNYRFGISEGGSLYNQKKELTYTLDSKEAYEAMKNEYKESKTINGVKGLAVFNDKKEMFCLDKMVRSYIDIYEV